MINNLQIMNTQILIRRPHQFRNEIIILVPLTIGGSMYFAFCRPAVFYLKSRALQVRVLCRRQVIFQPKGCCHSAFEADGRGLSGRRWRQSEQIAFQSPSAASWTQYRTAPTGGAAKRQKASRAVTEGHWRLLHWRQILVLLFAGTEDSDFTFKNFTFSSFPDLWLYFDIFFSRIP